MYFSIYASSEYYSDDDIHNVELLVDEKETCIICWLPSEQTNKIKNLSDFSQLKLECKCHPNIHNNCIYTWLNKSLTCPICRSKISIININSYQNNYFINIYIYVINKTIYGLKILCCASFLNLFCIFIYHVYYYIFYIYYFYFLMNHNYDSIY